MTLNDLLVSQLIMQEGFRPHPYKDTVGKLTIGFGRNLDDVGVSKQEALIMLNNDISVAVRETKDLFSGFDELGRVRQAVLVNMCFNIGKSKLVGFKGLRAAVEAKDYERAADEMLDSLWARQVGRRADTLANLMRTG